MIKIKIYHLEAIFDDRVAHYAISDKTLFNIINNYNTALIDGDDTKRETIIENAIKEGYLMPMPIGYYCYDCETFDAIFLSKKGHLLKGFVYEFDLQKEEHTIIDAHQVNFAE